MPHYGLIGQREARACLENSEAVTKEAAETITALVRAGKTTEEILSFFIQRDYTEPVKPIYPIDALTLNTRIMIERTRSELAG